MVYLSMVGPRVRPGTVESGRRPGMLEVAVGRRTVGVGPHKDEVRSHRAGVGPHRAGVGPHKDEVRSHRAGVGPYMVEVGPHMAVVGPHKVEVGPERVVVGLAGFEVAALVAAVAADELPLLESGEPYGAHGGSPSVSCTRPGSTRQRSNNRHQNTRGKQAEG